MIRMISWKKKRRKLHNSTNRPENPPCENPHPQQLIVGKSMKLQWDGFRCLHVFCEKKKSQEINEDYLKSTCIKDFLKNYEWYISSVCVCVFKCVFALNIPISWKSKELVSLPK